ncbi:MAG: hypothetical protein HY908_16415 [Myxococcales bacterium]|nr:hypothetical protein [Myxococcales bacterium]
MRSWLLLGACVVAAVSCGEAFRSDPGTGGSGAGGTTSSTTSTSTGGTTTSNGGAGGSGASGATGGAGGTAPSPIEAECGTWCDALEAQGCQVPVPGACRDTCIERFTPPSSSCVSAAKELLQCYAGHWTASCAIPADTCMPKLVAYADCLVDCNAANCTGTPTEDPCSCSATCTDFAVVAECSTFNLYCYCRLTGPIDLGPLDATAQVLCIGQSEIVCSEPTYGCCDAVFF